jgi:hypothetical protein
VLGTDVENGKFMRLPAPAKTEVLFWHHWKCAEQVKFWWTDTVSA